MGKCTCHPEIETPYICMKHQIYLCEECLECRDPDIYCKFRPSCPIWFMSKRKARLLREEEEKAAALQASLEVNFGPDGKTVRAVQGTTLLEAVRLADVHINASCNGKGACGKCKLMVTAGRTENPSTPLLSDTEKDGVKKLSRMVLATINALIGDVLDSAGIDAAQVKNVVVSGNTTMAHLLLKIEPRYIRREPYIPTVTEFPILKAGEIGFKTNPIAAVFTMPRPASYVGGDIVAGVLYTGLHREDPLTLFIDVGTNGEIVLGNKEWLMTAACSAGPAFEGGGIRWGMRAEEGAVEKVAIDPETFEPVWSTVGDQPPRGICGSGMIDLIFELLNAGIIDRSGRFQADTNHPRLSTIKDEAVFILVPADQTPMNEEIVFTDSDIKNLIYSKGAVYAGFTTLLNEAGIAFSMIDRIIIAGGFGQYLDIEKAVGIGLLPDIERTKFAYTGNSSIAGAYMALLSSTYREEASQISNAMTYIDFSSNSRYMDEFTSALFLPHTDLGMFPNVTSKVA